MNPRQFEGLLRRFQVPFQVVVKSKGYWDQTTGDWIPGEDEKTVTDYGAFVALPQRTVVQSGGMYTEEDRHLYTKRVIPMQTEVIHGGVKYQVHDKNDYAGYTTVNRYVLKWVSLFD
ncbi:hypothetical protein LQV63_04240 [Paenibacillus profundus]|uniref:Uncharacterized protein n=1 Tax=Paenibacillus profundus TaxID=1173085 RepID=A0ABS8Y9I0_9BACL|nr:hypothetical protein [Paenibacillus profundus]MCE5168523.1 hypothetical protein [Paenibacillus profundus]